MKQERLVIKRSSDVEDMHHMRLMALLSELVREWGYKGTARVLEIDPKTVTSSVKSGQLTHRVRESLERALQHGIGSAADRQRERSDRLEDRLEELEAQLKELKENHRTGLKRLKMSLDGVRKYYGVQHRLIEQRLLSLEADREGVETAASADDESRALGLSSVVAREAHPEQLTGPPLVESLDAGERLSTPLQRDMKYAAHGADTTEAPAGPDVPRRAQRSKRNLYRSQRVGHDMVEAD